MSAHDRTFGRLDDLPGRIARLVGAGHPDDAMPTSSQLADLHNRDFFVFFYFLRKHTHGTTTTEPFDYWCGVPPARGDRFGID